MEYILNGYIFYHYYKTRGYGDDDVKCGKTGPAEFYFIIIIQSHLVNSKLKVPEKIVRVGQKKKVKL